MKIKSMDFLNYLRNPFILNKLLIATTFENPLGTGLPVRVYWVGEKLNIFYKIFFYALHRAFLKLYFNFE